MNLTAASFDFQIIANFLGLIEFILAIYILLLNFRQSSNRLVGGLLLLFAAISLGQGMAYGARTAVEAKLYFISLAMLTPAVGPALLLVSLVLLKPNWYRRRTWPVWALLYVMIILPAALTLADLFLGTHLYYTGLANPGQYQGGAVFLDAVSRGMLARPIILFDLYFITLFTFLPLVYILAWDKQIWPGTRRLAALLIATQLAAAVIEIGFAQRLVMGLSTLLTSLLFGITYAYAGFRQMISERRLQHGLLRTRLTILMLGITIPLLVALAALITSRATLLVQQDAEVRLKAANQAVVQSTTLWLDNYARSLERLTAIPGLAEMDSSQQTRLLQSMPGTYSYPVQISTVRLDGLTIANSLGLPAQDYDHRAWFIEARDQAPFHFYLEDGQSDGKAAILAAKPIFRSDGKVASVAVISTPVQSLIDQVLENYSAGPVIAYLVDKQSLLIGLVEGAEFDPSVSIEAYPPVQVLSQGHLGSFSFNDQNQVRWMADIGALDNGWGVVVQQRMDEINSGVLWVRQITWQTSLAATILVTLLIWLAIRQAFQPINTLTATARAIASGQIDKTAPVESNDEIGLLASSFNQMTARLRSLINNLEQRINERTQEVEKRSELLKATVLIGQATTSVLDPEELISKSVELIREQFRLYYVGLFLIDEQNSWAILRAGTGVAGKQMLERGHRLEIGGTSMIGWCIANARSRIALEARQDPMRLATAELPETRSEAALPLRSRGQVIGAISVQSTQPNAFNEDILAVLQIMADQLAVAIDNAQLFSQSQSALEAERRAFGKIGREGWRRWLETRDELSFRSDSRGGVQATSIWRPEMHEAATVGKTVFGKATWGTTGNGNQVRQPVAIPIKVRGTVIGILDTFKHGEWSQDEITLLENITEQIGVALDSAKLYEQTQQRAEQEQMIGKVTRQMRETLDIDTVLQTAAREVAQALGLEEVIVELTAGEGQPD